MNAWAKVASPRFAALVGLSVGALICVMVALVRASATGPRTSDTMMGAQVLADAGALPLALITERLQGALSASGGDASSMWAAVDYLEIILNWLAISVVISIAVRWWRRRENT